MKNKLWIIGAGWLGAYFAKSYKDEYDFLASTTSAEREDLHSNEITQCPYLLGTSIPARVIEFNPEQILIAVPPSKIAKGAVDLSRSLAEIESKLSAKLLCYISSTGIYGSSGKHKEDSKNLKPGKLLELEHAVSRSKVPHVVLRMGGLYNNTDRHPANWFKNKDEILDGYANLVDQQDAAAAINHVVSKGLTGTYNVCHPEITTKSQVYPKAFEDADTKAPKVIDTADLGKEILVEKLLNTGFSFIYPSAISVFTSTKKG